MTMYAYVNGTVCHWMPPRPEDRLPPRKPRQIRCAADGTLPAEAMPTCMTSPFQSHSRRKTANAMLLAMNRFKAVVRSGRIVIDEPTDLPEGMTLALAVVEDDGMTDEERARLHE